MLLTLDAGANAIGECGSLATVAVINHLRGRLGTRLDHRLSTVTGQPHQYTGEFVVKSKDGRTWTRGGRRRR